MTITNEPGAEVAVPTELVTVIIDGVAVGVPKGTLVIRAAEMLGCFPSRNGRGGEQHGTEQRSKHGVRRGKLKRPDCHAMFAVAL